MSNPLDQFTWTGTETPRMEGCATAVKTPDGDWFFLVAADAAALKKVTRHLLDRHPPEEGFVNVRVSFDESSAVPRPS
jgi:hypothetical protein